MRAKAEREPDGGGPGHRERAALSDVPRGAPLGSQEGVHATSAGFLSRLRIDLGQADPGAAALFADYASPASAPIATVPSGVTAHSSQRPFPAGRPRSSNGALSNSGPRAWVV